MPDLQVLLDQIDPLDRLDQEATQAPWKSHFGGNPHDEWLSVEPEKGSRTICTVTDDHHPNAEFIVLARTVLPQLAKALQAVMEIHKPLNVGGIDGDHIICEVCVTINGYGGWDQRDHPCETYQAITDAMEAQ